MKIKLQTNIRTIKNVLTLKHVPPAGIYLFKINNGNTEKYVKSVQD